MKCPTAAPGSRREHRTRCMSRKKSKQRSLSVLLDLMPMGEMSFSWLLSLVMYFPDANSTSGTPAVTQRRVGSALNEFILDVRARFPADQLPAVPGSETSIICEILYGPNPRSGYRSSSKPSQALSSQHGVGAVPGPGSSPACSSNSTDGVSRKKRRRVSRGAGPSPAEPRGGGSAG